jgi:hypothetical protein
MTFLWHIREGREVSPESYPSGAVSTLASPQGDASTRKYTAERAVRRRNSDAG